VAKLSYQALFGAILLILGILLLLRTTGIYDTDQLLKYIPSLFILLGLYTLLKSGFSNIEGPIILITLFTTLQLLILGMISWETISSLWPILIIIMGIGILVNRKRSPLISRKNTEKVDLFTIFGEVKSSSNSLNFRGGDITAIFGEVNLDLRDSKVEEKPAKINVISILGEVNITVPEEWKIQMEVLPILGDAEDERPRSQTRREIDTENPDLIVTGFAALGEISVKD
jgi:predicted membrane protein